MYKGRAIQLQREAERKAARSRKDGTGPLKLARKKASEGTMANLKTFHGITMEFNNMYYSLKDKFPDLDEEVIRNIIAYCRCLPKPGTAIVDKNIFFAQMIQRFNLTDSLLIGSMYDVTRGFEKNSVCTTEKFAHTICIFCCTDHVPKVRFVFNVYNIKQDGFLNKRDLTMLIAPMLDNLKDADSDESDPDDALRYLVDMMMASIDANGDGDLSPEEFMDMVGSDPMMMQCLGPCLPEQKEREEFLDLMRNKTTVDVSAMFRHERRTALWHPDVSDPGLVQQHYPVPLELL